MTQPIPTEPELRVRLSGTEADRDRTVWWECPHCHAWGTKHTPSDPSAVDDLVAALREEHAHGSAGTSQESLTVAEPVSPGTRSVPAARRPRWNSAVSQLLKLRPPWAA